MSLLASDIVWRLRQVGLIVEDYQIRWAIRHKRIAIAPRKNPVGHYQFTDADFKAIEVYFRAKEAKKS